MAVDPLVGVQAALRQNITREINDVVSYRYGFMGAAMAMDDHYGVADDPEKRRFNRDMDVSGFEVQWDMLSGLPVVSGVQHRSGAVGAFAIADQENFTTFAAHMGWSAYQFLETIRVSTINRHSNNKSKLANYVEQVSKACRTAVVKKLEEDFFPLDNVDNAPTSYDMAEDKVQAVSYPLLANVAGTYEYASINMNAAGYTGMRATVYGEVDGTPNFGTPTPSKIRTQLLNPMTLGKMSQPDVAFCDSSVLDYMIQQAESKVVIEMQEKLKYGALMVNYCGLTWMPLYRLDQLAATGGKVREILVLESKNHVFKTFNLANVSLIEPDNKPGLRNAQGYMEIGYFNLAPNHDGRGVDVRLS